MRRADGSQQGASAVEFALLAPLFVALLFGIVEFGSVIYTKGMLTHASREGARFGVVYTIPRRSAAEIQAIVRNYLDTTGLTNPATVAVTGAGGASESQLTVRVNYAYNFVVLSSVVNAFFGGTLPTSIDLTATTVMIME
jgi:Flp pilus assembly protein TadG